jgi:hypothetical protein
MTLQRGQFSFLGEVTGGCHYEKGSIMSKKVTDWQLVNHGVDGSQHFPGCGTAYTGYTHVATGCGDNPAEALDDALDMIAQGEENVDTEDLLAQILSAEGLTEFPEKPSAGEEFLMNTDWQEGETEDDIMADCDNYYYLSIRYNLPASKDLQDDEAVDLDNDRERFGAD